MQEIERSPPSHHKLEEGRPARIEMASVMPVTPLHKRWNECKIVGKNVTVRSYAGACSHGSELFVYGGLQILSGILADFHSINLGQEEGRFQWKEITANGDNPGPRAKCGMVCTKQGVIYLIGGIKSTTSISNEIYSYTIATQTWRRVEHQGELPPLESFGCCLVGDEKVLMVCGYQGTVSSETSAIYQFNIADSQITKLFDHSESKNSPTPRSNCGAATDGKSVYIFGGCRGDLRMNDLWRFDLNSSTWLEVKTEGEFPTERSGHILEYEEGCLLMYGGLHQVTWELDDLQLFDLKQGKWKILEVDSARKRKFEDVEESHKSEKISAREVHSPGKKREDKYFTDTVTTMKHRNSDAGREIHPHDNPERQPHSGSMLSEKRKKDLLHKKAEMLKLFEINEENKEKYLSVEPVSQALKNSLDIVCSSSSKDHGNNHRLNDFGKSSVSKFLQPLSNNVNVVYGKKPCARDGHNSARIGQYIVIFGGDRHHMSFNDLYRLDTRDIKKEFS